MAKLKIIGHRGARGLAPENTIKGMKKALDHRVDMIEFDVRVSKDGVPLLHHDKAIKDGSGKRLKIKDTAFEGLKAHAPDLATLAEVLAFINGRVTLYIEVKMKVDIGPIVEVLKGYNHPLLLASKSQKTLVALHTAMPGVPTLVIEPWSGMRAHLRAREVDAKIVSMNRLWLWSGFISAFSGGHYELFCYTLNNPSKARRWAKRGLAGVVTDFPDRFESSKE